MTTKMMRKSKAKSSDGKYLWKKGYSAVLLLLTTVIMMMTNVVTNMIGSICTQKEGRVANFFDNEWDDKEDD